MPVRLLKIPLSKQTLFSKISQFLRRQKIQNFFQTRKKPAETFLFNVLRL